MSPWPVDAEVEEVHTPRPGHADLAGLLKFGHSDVRNVLERASARETAARVAAGALAKELLGAFGVSVHSHVVQIGSVQRSRARRPQRRGLRRRGLLARSLPRSGCERGDGGRDRPPAQGEREPRRDLRGEGLRPGAGAGLPHRLGGAPGRPPGPGAGLDPGRQGSLGGGGLGGGRQARLRVARRDPLVRGARLAPGDQPRRRRRGRDVERRAALRARGAEADLDPDQAAALGRHRDQGAGRGASRAHRLDRGPGGRRGGRGDGRPGAGSLLPGEVRRRPHRRRARARWPPTGSGSGGDARGQEGVAQPRRRAGGRRSSSSASWAPARRPPPTPRAPRAWRRSRPTSCSRASSGCRSPSSSAVAARRSSGASSPPR